MRILPEPIAFQWDEGNTQHIKKHDVSAQEAEEVFVGEPFLTVEDSRHSTETERRFQGLGQTKVQRKLFVVFTIRDKKIRVISIRDMKRKERKAYEELEKNS